MNEVKLVLEVVEHAVGDADRVGGIFTFLWAAKDRAAKANKRTNIMIERIGEPPIALHDTQGFLALRSVSIIRRLPQDEQPAEVASLALPLRVLLVTTRPDNAGVIDQRAIAKEPIDEVQAQVADSLESILPGGDAPPPARRAHQALGHTPGSWHKHSLLTTQSSVLSRPHHPHPAPRRRPLGAQPNRRPPGPARPAPLRPPLPPPRAKGGAGAA